jgi:hypothetical protein
MESVVRAWSRRARQQGVVGPFTCARCQWSGTFWLLAVGSRFPRWRVGRHALVRRNCGHAADVTRAAAPALVDSAVPVLVADPLGPQSTRADRGEG